MTDQYDVTRRLFMSFFLNTILYGSYNIRIWDTVNVIWYVGLDLESEKTLIDFKTRQKGSGFLIINSQHNLYDLVLSKIRKG